MNWEEIRHLLFIHLQCLGLSREDAEDGAQDVVCRLWSNKTVVRGPQYLWVAAKHYAADCWRRKKKIVFLPLIEECHNGIDIDVLAQKEALRKLGNGDKEFLSDYIMRDFISGKDRIRAMRIRRKLQEIIG